MFTSINKNIMARITKKGLSGSAGPVIFFTMFGKEFVKAKPGKKGKKKKKLDDLPESQQRSAKDFKYVMNTLQPFKQFLRTGFKAEAVDRHTFSEAMHVNLENYLDRDETSGNELSWISVSGGTRANATGLQAKIIEGSQLSITWTGAQANRSAEANDVVMVAITAGRGKPVQSVMLAGHRADGKVLINLDEQNQHIPLHCFIAFRSNSLKKLKRNSISVSRYLFVRV